MADVSIELLNLLVCETVGVQNYVCGIASVMIETKSSQVRITEQLTRWS